MKYRGPVPCAILSASILLLTSCANPMIPTAGINSAAGSATAELNHASFCQIARPITYSSRDTPPTLEEITEHNCVGHTLCGWQVGANTCPAVP